MMISLFSKGSLLWIPSETKRWVNDGDQLKLFPSTLSVTKTPMLGIFRTYTCFGDVEVLCPDGIWTFSQDDVKPYNGARKRQRENIC